MLTEEHKLKRQASALDLLTRYSEEGDNFLNRVITVDETWVSHATSGSKQQSMEWMKHFIANKDEIQADHFNLEDHGHSVLGQKKNVLLVDFLPQDSTINAGVYCDTLKNCVARSRISDVACVAGVL